MIQTVQLLIILFLIAAIVLLGYAIKKMKEFERNIAHIDQNIQKMLSHVAKKQKRLEEEIGGLS